jgi:hypothetical protein
MAALTFIEEQDRADARDNDAIAEYWVIVNDPASPFGPLERVELIGIARWCSANIARRANMILRTA